MKKACVSILLALMMLFMSGCSGGNRIVLNNTDIVITAAYDPDGMLIQRSEHNRKTNITTSYIYIRSEDHTTVEVLTIDSEGNIIRAEKLEPDANDLSY